MRKFARYCSRFFSFIFSIFPWMINAWLGQFFSFLWCDVLRIRRQVVFNNIDIAFPGTPLATKHFYMKRSLEVLCRGLFDVMRIPHLTPDWFDSVQFHGIENLQKSGQDYGCLFLSLHIGSGDLAAAAISEKIIPLSLISKRFKNQFLDEFWFSLRTRSKTQFIDAHSQQNAFEILKAVKNKRGVIFVLDQFMGKPYGIKTEFFGRSTGTAYGLALFALKTKVPVIPLYTHFDDKNNVHVTFRPAIDLSAFNIENKDEQLRQITNRFNQELEQIIRQHPEQWMWVHRRWKDFE